jgi:hypothetical protein
MLVPVLCLLYSTYFINFLGDQKVWPIYLTISNIKSSFRIKPSSIAMILIALLSILIKLSKIQINVAKSQRFRSQMILDYALYTALLALYSRANDKDKLQCTDD